ncbi:MAG: aspartate aminotransferase family protein [Candidatus Eremiobacteraeota bacterium]|nr:aspartate aminotransferase family protein [Candidatus Eremiobacteraeota bacterium]MCW5871202.1 aspartate aminotransferase family protein [Candidatus Eremiobacteraeota bacterium]
MPTYQSILNELRRSFPQPTSDRIHDSYVTHTVMRVLDQVDALKSELPIWGSKLPLDYELARQSRLHWEGKSLEEVSSELVSYLNGLNIWGHPKTQINICPPPTVASLVAQVISGLASPNLVWDEVSQRFALAEVEVASIVSELMGYDSQTSAGIFTFGGTGCTLYAHRIALEKALPGSLKEGVRQDAAILVSANGHYCKLTVAGWLGLGQKNVHAIPTDARNQIRLDLLEERAREILAGGGKIACFMATVGTTDCFALDDVEAIVRLRDRLVQEFSLDYSPHVHADAVIGWAWSVFRDYQWEANPLGFRPRTVRALAATVERLAGLELADSIGIDFHKTGFTPYVSSLLLVKESQDLRRLGRGYEEMPYLFQTGEYHPGLFTLETSRSGSGILSALANLRLFGRTGLQSLLGHLVEKAQVLRELLEARPYLTIVNRDNFGPVTLFRAYPNGIDTFRVHERELTDPAFAEQLVAHNEYNRRLSRFLHTEAMSGRGVLLGQSDCFRLTPFGLPIVALKSYITSPFVEDLHLEQLVEKIAQAQRLM